MSLQSSGSSHPLLSCTDGIATGMSDALLLIGRVLIARCLLLTAWFGSPNAGYLTSLGYPNPDMMSTLAIVVEYIVIISLVLGLGTRYGALLGSYSSSLRRLPRTATGPFRRRRRAFNTFS